MPTVEIYADCLEHLQGALLVLTLALHRQVLRWRATHHEQAAPEELLGLCISDRDVDLLLDGLYAANASPEADGADRAPIATLTSLLQDARARHQARETASRVAGIPLRLPDLVEKLELSYFEQQTLLLTLAPELDRRHERLFGYLNDDVTRGYPTVGLAMDLFCADLSERLVARKAFHESGKLRSLRLLQLSQDSGPFPPSLLSRGLKLEERLVDHLLGIDPLVPPTADLLQLCSDIPVPPLAASVAERVTHLAHYLAQASNPVPAIAIRGTDLTLQRQVAAQLVADTSLLLLDAAYLETHPQPKEVIHRALREVWLRGIPLAIQNLQQLSADKVSPLLRPLLTADCPHPRFLLLPDRWQHEATTGLTLLELSLPAPDRALRQQLWATALNGHVPDPDLDLASLADRFRLTSGQIAAAASHAEVHVAAFGLGDRPTQVDLFTSCRAQSSSALGELAQHIESIYTWDDLILPSSLKNQLESLEDWVRYRHVVYGDWGFSQQLMLGQGLAVLFSGPSGTGKTMAAGILARNLGLDLYQIDLSTVVSKYIGETEKNLSRIFKEAESANAILFFDEADALFGKRSEVKDAHDRYANIEVSYLLQRMEAYDGMAILATNFRQNLDPAFARRLRFAIEFPFPQTGDRQRIWKLLLPPTVPQAPDIDFAFLSRQFSLAGGNIKNCVLTAAFAAAATAQPIAMRHIIPAVVRELEKLEQPIVSSDFGNYRDLIRN